VRPLNAGQVMKILSQLRQKGKFKEFESRLKQQGKRLAESLMQAAVDETQKRVLIGLALEGGSGKVFDYALLMAARPQGTDDWELSGEAEPRASGCQAVRATATSAVPLYVGDESSYPMIGYYSGGTVCSYGGTYSCIEVYSSLSVSPLQIDFGLLLLGGFREQSITVTNSRWTTTVTVSTSPPFWLVSGSSLVTSLSFSLGGGQSQEVKVRFRPTASGNYSAQVSFSREGIVEWTVAVKGSAITLEEFFNAQAAAYNTEVQLGRQPSMLVQEGPDEYALLHGFPQLSGEMIGQLLDLANQTQGPASTQTPSETTAYSWDPQKVLEVLKKLLLDYSEKKDLARLLGLTLCYFSGCDLPDLKISLDPDFRNFVLELMSRLNTKVEGDTTLVGLIAALLQDIYSRYKPVAPGTGTLIDLLILLYETFFKPPQPGQEIDLFKQAAGVLAMLMALSSQYPQVQGILNTLFSCPQNAELCKDQQVRGVLAMVFSVASFAKDMGSDTQALQKVTNQFFDALLKALTTFYDDPSGWAGFINLYLRALTNPNLIKYPEGYANMAASLIVYVHLGTAGWTINSVPAVLVLQPGVSISMGSFVHIVARKTMTIDGKTVTVTGLFHVEAHLAANDVGGLVKDIELLNDNLYKVPGFFNDINFWPDKKEVAIIIVAWGIDNPQTAQTLKTELDKLDLKVPVYVVWIDSNGYVWGFCVGPRCSDEILKKIALDIFGAEPGKQVPWWADWQKFLEEMKKERQSFIRIEE